MGLFIEKIHTLLGDLEGKNIASQRPPEQVDRVLHLIISDLFNKYLDHYVKTKKIDNFLMHFRRPATINLAAGLGNLPPDYAHHRQLYLADGKTKIAVIPDKFWPDRVNRKLGPPSLTEPIARIEYTETPELKLEVVPATISSVKLMYFKTPAVPKFAYDLVSSRYVYNEAASVDVEFPIGLYPDIMNRLLGAFGITLREGQMIQITETLKAQEQIK